MNLIFLKPRNIGFLIRMFIEKLQEKFLQKEEIASAVRNYVLNHANKGDPDSILKTMDDFAQHKRFLMNVGDVKGSLLLKEISKLGKNLTILELGCFCGYSAILMAKNLGGQGKVISIEINKNYAAIANEIIEFAGLKNKVIIIEGPSEKIIPTLRYKFDLIFIDHWKDLYKRDLQLIEKRGLLRDQSVVFADNVGNLIEALVGKRGKSSDYLKYVRNHKHFKSKNIKTNLEYSNAEDAVEISTYSITD
tara:strand:+ start:123 stop:869 length:747 start_codon:yes stop_codon:yes gene_type:complete